MKKIVLLALVSLMITVIVSLSTIPPNYMSTTSPNTVMAYSSNSVTSTSSLKTNTTQAIYSNSGFTGVNSPWTGSGTKTSPYVLDGYNISTSSSADTIYIQGTTAYFVIKNCYLSANSSSSYGINLVNVANGVIENNTINYSSIGIGASTSSNITIMKNIITNSGDTGINLSTNNLLTIYNNTITGSQNNGLYSLMGSNSTVTYNNISYNDWSGNPAYYGITDDGSGVNITYSHNIVNYNGQDGIWVHSYSDDTVTYNTVEHNTGNGIYFGSSVTTPGLMNVSYNYIAYNTQDGINLHLAVGNTVTNNVIIYNGANGVNSGYQNSDNYFANNNISYNTGDGFYINSSSNNISVIGNNIISNSYGLLLYGSTGFYGSNSTFENNTISNSTSDGIYITSNNNNTFINNFVDNSTYYGVNVVNSNDNTFYLNSFVNNFPNTGVISKVHTFSSIRTNSLATTYNIQGYDSNTNNHWTNGHYGNYWSNYAGTDANNDGIGDSNYTLNGGLMVNDTLPLMFPNIFSLKSALTLNFEQGSQNHIVKWPVTGYETINYVIYQNNIEIAHLDGLIINGSFSINYIADALTLGTYTFKLVVTNVNTSSQLQSSTTVTVVDTTAPNLSVSPTSLTFVEGTTGHSLSIKASDLNPGSYIVYENGTQFTKGSWTSSANITISVDSLKAGSYNFTAVVFDKSNNQAEATVMITVTPAPQTTTSLSISTTVPNTTTISSSTSKHSNTPGFETIVSLLSLGIFGIFYLQRKKRNY